MELPDSVTCPGCGLSLPEGNFVRESPLFTSRECWHLFGELSGYTLSLRDPAFLHQHAVDAYEAQHVGPDSKNISASFGLIGLYLALEKGYTGKEVQKAHMILASRSKIWPRFNAPAHTWELTVKDVLKSSPGPGRDAKIMEWARSVWHAWEKDHESVRALAARYLFL